MVYKVFIFCLAAVTSQNVEELHSALSSNTARHDHDSLSNNAKYIRFLVQMYLISTLEVLGGTAS